MRSERGNAAAMREALVALIAYWDWNGFDAMRESKLKDMARAALAAPPRNCDRFSSADEAIGAYRQTHKNMVVNVFLDWLFAPAAERKGEDNGSK